MIRCSCNSQGNPPPSLVWELAGEPVNHSDDLPIRVVPLGSIDMRSVITLRHLDEDLPSLICLSINSLGSDSFTFNVSAIETQLGLHLYLTFLNHNLVLLVALIIYIVAFQASILSLC